jgi:POT family proton-dependent oligopeptide transporter
MWERFSYYGMRAILVLFLISSIDNEGWGWDRAEALELYALYTGLVYVTPIFGGLIADRLIGYRKAIVAGAFLMTLGHAAMALEVFYDFYLYVGLALLILGNGLFKPNISSIVGQMYKDDGKIKDAAYTIFYMGINSGAFLGILLCGYIGENVNWHYGFGLAGIFMLFGMLQFHFGQKIFGNIGLKKSKENDNEELETNDHKVSRNIIVDRLIVIGIFSFVTIFFWWGFEQAGGSMTIFANDYTDRNLVGTGALIFKIVNTLLTVVPMIILTIILYLLFKNTFEKYAVSNIFLASSFVIIWGLVIWMLSREFLEDATEVPASWFAILNSFFIILFAPILSRLWQSKYNPSGPVKFGIGLMLLSFGFAILSFGSINIPLGASTASQSMIFLILAYLFHTLGELCVSPVGLSYVSKLAPKKIIGLMFAIWLLSSAIANFFAGITGSYIDPIVQDYGMSIFFLIFTILPASVGLLMILANKKIVTMMHGIE